MIRLIAISLVLVGLILVPLRSEERGLWIGSKAFTESVILGEIAATLVRGSGVPVTHLRELGGTKLVFEALARGEIDLYPDYTGTVTEEILAGEKATTDAELRSRLATRGVTMSPTLGFENSYALGMLKPRAQELRVSKISDLARHPDLRLGLSNEFVDREYGWKRLRGFYGLPQRDVTGLEHDLAYRQLELGAIDVMDVYTTDAKIAALDLEILEDDRGCFPRYDAVLLMRQDLEHRYPEAVRNLRQMEGAISAEAMIGMNGSVELDRRPETAAAEAFVESRIGLAAKSRVPGAAERIRDRTLEHLDLVRKSLIPAILVAIPLGILAARARKSGPMILAAVGIVQTIPALALLVMLMPAVSALGARSVGLGSATAIVALFLYSLLPIVRNTVAGLRGIAREHQEAARALGLPERFRLTTIDLPLASPSILAGIKTAAVINVGFATLGALVGAGGYGQPILTGIRLNDTALILEGAVPAAVLALLVQGGFELLERYLVPRGLRTPRASL